MGDNPVLFPRQGWKPRWTKDVMLEIWAMREGGWTVQLLADAMGIGRDRLKQVLKLWEPRREELQDRERRPAYWAEVDAMRAKRRKNERQRWKREQAKKAREIEAEEAKRRAEYAAWLAQQPKQPDGSVRLWDPRNIR